MTSASSKNPLFGAFGASFLSTVFATWGTASFSLGAVGSGVLAGIGAVVFLVLQSLSVQKMWRSVRKISNRVVVIYCLSLIFLPVIAAVVAYRIVATSALLPDIVEEIYADTQDPLVSILGGIAGGAAIVINAAIIAYVVVFLIILSLAITWFVFRYRHSKKANGIAADKGDIE